MRAVVRNGRFIGVVAEREEQAVAAVAALAKYVRWNEPADLPDVDELAAYLRSLPAKPMVLSEKGTPLEAGAQTTERYLLAGRSWRMLPLARPAPSRARKAERSRSGAKASRSIRPERTSRQPSASQPMRSRFITCKGQGATGITAPTMRRSTPCCSRERWRDIPSGCNGRMKTSSLGRLLVPPWLWPCRARLTAQDASSTGAMRCGAILTSRGPGSRTARRCWPHGTLTRHSRSRPASMPYLAANQPVSATPSRSTTFSIREWSITSSIACR